MESSSVRNEILVENTDNVDTVLKGRNNEAQIWGANDLSKKFKPFEL